LVTLVNVKSVGSAPATVPSALTPSCGNGALANGQRCVEAAQGKRGTDPVPMSSRRDGAISLESQFESRWRHCYDVESPAEYPVGHSSFTPATTVPLVSTRDSAMPPHRRLGHGEDRWVEIITSETPAYDRPICASAKLRESPRRC
jgi:hypothetical protein